MAGGGGRGGHRGWRALAAAALVLVLLCGGPSGAPGDSPAGASAVSAETPTPVRATGTPAAPAVEATPLPAAGGKGAGGAPPVAGGVWAPAGAPRAGLSETGRRAAAVHWLTWTNQLRALAGLPAVAENTGYSQNALLHSQYIVRSGDFTHYENAGSAYYTAGGADSGVNSNISGASAASVFPDDAAYVTSWINAPFHLLHMLNPRLQQVGYARYDAASGDPASSPWKTAGTFDVSATRGTASNPLPPGFTYPLMFPGPGTTMPVYSFPGYETPQPPAACGGRGVETGPGILLSLANAVPAGVTATVRRNGALIQSCVFDGTNYVDDADGGVLTGVGKQLLNFYNAVVVVPRSPLTDGGAYEVAVTVPGDRTYRWTFYTAGAGPVGTATATPTRTATATATPVPQTYPQGGLKLVSPVRVLDTRACCGGPIGFNVDGTRVAAGALPAGATRRYGVAGRTFGNTAIPAGVTGLLLNVTTVRPSAAGGFVTVFPGDAASPPNASTVNPSTAVAHNFTEVAVPTAGANAGVVGVFTSGDADLVIDVVGYRVAPGAQVAGGAAGNLQFVTPVRVIDTRPGANLVGFDGSGAPIGAGPLNAGASRQFRLAGQTFTSGGGRVTIPADATGILAHVTTVQANASGGFVTLYPGGTASPPNASTVNPSTAIAFNTTAVGLGAAGAAGAGNLAVFSTNALDLVVDVLGYWSPTAPSAGALTLTSPVRIVDTRGSPLGPVGFLAGGAAMPAGPLTPGASRVVQVGGRSFAGLAIPADIRGVLVNVTLVQDAPSGGYVVAYPGDQAVAPNTSTVNPSTAIAASFWANGVAPSGANAGQLALYSTNAADLVVDLVGYYR